jgi:hypothetical protein
MADFDLLKSTNGKLPTNRHFCGSAAYQRQSAHASGKRAQQQHRQGQNYQVLSKGQVCMLTLHGRGICMLQAHKESARADIRPIICGLLTILIVQLLWSCCCATLCHKTKSLHIMSRRHQELVSPRSPPSLAA